MHDIIIIGAGPAGMTAAIYARRAKKNVLILESSTYGGQIINTLHIENYPVEAHISGYEFANKLYNQVKDLGAEFVFERVVSVELKDGYKEVVTNHNRYQAKAVIIATGSKSRKLNLPNEESFLGKGVSYCATCDGNFYRNKIVAVVGSNSVALEDALYLSNIVEKVYFISPEETLDDFSNLMEKIKEKDNIEVLMNYQVVELVGIDHLEAVKIKNQTEEELKISGLFVAIGQVPSSALFKNLIHLDDNGYIVAEENCHTNQEGIFVAGDGRTKKLRQLVTATADGAVAATEAIQYISHLE